MRPRPALSVFFLNAAFLAAAGSFSAQAPPREESAAPSEAARRDLLDRVIAGQHRDDDALDLYERIERRESRKAAGDASPAPVQVLRVFPVGTGLDRIPLGADGKPSDPAAYRQELRKLERALAWTLVDGRAQRDAFDKYARHRKERADLVDAARDGFLYTWQGREIRNGRPLAKLRMEPNPSFKRTSRLTSVFSKVRGTVWVDESAAQLVRVEAEITEDIPFGGGLFAKVYKGGRFVLEHAEVAPGIWLPVLYDFDFDGRKFLFGFRVHEHTTVSQYRRVGPPREALEIIRAELNKTQPDRSDP